MKKVKKIIKYIVLVVVIASATIVANHFFRQVVQENRVLKQVIDRLQAESRVAEALVTGVEYDEKTRKLNTTIKFLEFDALGRPLAPKYFTFTGNLIQFQSLVVRFEDIHIRKGDRLRGKSAYLFWKVFMLDGQNTQEYEITKTYQIPDGYKVGGVKHRFEEKLWQEFWTYALDPKQAKKMGIKNAQIEAPGTMFIPGTLYTISIEHDGGMKIGAIALPPILRGEYIPQ